MLCAPQHPHVPGSGCRTPRACSASRPSTCSHISGGDLHITLRDLRSALAYMLVGIRDCDEIHALYANGKAEEIANGFYFNSWMGGDTPTGDRLLALLKDVDIGANTSPQLDRRFDYVNPLADRALMTFEQRGTYDRDILNRALLRSAAWLDGENYRLSDACASLVRQYGSSPLFLRMPGRRTLAPYAAISGCLAVAGLC